MLQHPVQALLGLVQGDVAELAVAANDQVQGVVAEDGHPHEDVAEGQQEAAEHELTDGAAARDTGQEHAHEGGPRDPPGPEEQGPGVEPLIGPVVGVGLQREPWEAGEEVADGAHECVNEEGGVTGDEHPQGQADGQEHVDGGQDAHAPVDAGDGRDGGHDDGQGGQPDLGGEALRQPEQDAEGHVQLDDADPQRGRDAEDPADQGRGVDDVADDALGVPAQQRAQGRAQRERVTASVGEVGHGQAHQRVQAPARDAVVEQGQDDRVAGGLGGLALPGGRVHVLVDRLGDGEEQDLGTDTGREEHGRPGEGGEVRRRVVWPQAHPTEAGEGQRQDEDERGGDEEDVEGAEPAARPGHGRAEGIVDHLGGEDRGQGDDRDDGGRHEEDHRVEGLLVRQLAEHRSGEGPDGRLRW